MRTPLALLVAQVDDPKGYGRVVREAGAVKRIVEDRDCTDAQRAIREVNVGVYVAEAALLRTALANLSSNNAQGELYLTRRRRARGEEWRR